MPGATSSRGDAADARRGLQAQREQHARGGIEGRTGGRRAAARGDADAERIGRRASGGRSAICSSSRSRSRRAQRQHRRAGRTDGSRRRRDRRRPAAAGRREGAAGRPGRCAAAVGPGAARGRRGGSGARARSARASGCEAGARRCVRRASGNGGAEEQQIADATGSRRAEDGRGRRGRGRETRDTRNRQLASPEISREGVRETRASAVGEAPAGNAGGAAGWRCCRDGKVSVAIARAGGDIGRLQRQLESGTAAHARADGSPPTQQSADRQRNEHPEQHEWSRSAPGTEAFKQDYAAWQALAAGRRASALERAESSTASKLSDSAARRNSSPRRRERTRAGRVPLAGLRSSLRVDRDCRKMIFRESASPPWALVGAAGRRAFSSPGWRTGSVRARARGRRWGRCRRCGSPCSPGWSSASCGPSAIRAARPGTRSPNSGRRVAEHGAGRCRRRAADRSRPRARRRRPAAGAVAALPHRRSALR